MGRVLVLYDSASGNTAKMAALVAAGAGGIPGTEVRLRTVEEATADDVLWCDGLALGSPTNMGLLSWKMKRFWDGPMAPHWMKVDGKVGCAFSSSGGWGGGTELACQSLLTVLINFGFLVFGVTDYAGKLTTAHYGAVTAREPREEGTRAACRLLGKRLAEWVAVFCDGRKDQHPLAKPDSRLPPGLSSALRFTSRCQTVTGISDGYFPPGLTRVSLRRRGSDLSTGLAGTARPQARRRLLWKCALIHERGDGVGLESRL